LTRKFNATVPVVRNERINDAHVRLGFSFPDFAKIAKPGQFATLATAVDDFSILRRPISLHRVLPDGEVQLLIKVLGRGTRALTALQVGQTIDVLGPLGDGVFSLAPDRPNVLIVAGGIGIAPFRFLLDAITPDRGFHPALFFGGRSARELPTHEELRELDLELHLATEDGSVGDAGLVTVSFGLKLATLDPSKTQVVACGPNPMLRAVAGMCREAGVPCQVSLENMMACGTGACRGCVVPVLSDPEGGDIPFARVCHEGPVFAAEGLVWERIA
jgi:dihydroorotate dehydrogenase electron transfer subunit